MAQAAAAATSVGACLGKLASSVVRAEDGRRVREALPSFASPTSVASLVGCGMSYFPQFVLPRRGIATFPQAMATGMSVLQGEGEKEKKKQAVPLPVVHIDQHSDPDATIVELSFGDRLGALLDTTKALKNLGLNVVKAQVTTEASMAKNKFYITRSDNGNKVEKPEMLEAIRLTIINNLLKYHPESSEQLYLGETFGASPPSTKLDVDVATHITVKKVNSKQSLLTVETADRPGLLLDIIRVITEINIMVESAEIDTEGLVATDQFYVSYGGAALSKSLEEVLTNCLRYYIRKVDTEDDSY